MLRYLSANFMISEKRTVFVGTDYVQEHQRIFAPNGGYHVNAFRDTPGFENWVFPSFSWGIFSHEMRLDQSRASENIL